MAPWVVDVDAGGVGSNRLRIDALINICKRVVVGSGCSRNARTVCCDFSFFHFFFRTKKKAAAKLYNNKREDALRPTYSKNSNWKLKRKRECRRKNESELKIKRTYTRNSCASANNVYVVWNALIPPGTYFVYVYGHKYGGFSRCEEEPTLQVI